MLNPIEEMFFVPHWRRQGSIVCRECGAVVNLVSQYIHWNWHQRSQNRRIQLGILYETVNALWGDI